MLPLVDGYDHIPAVISPPPRVPEYCQGQGKARDIARLPFLVLVRYVTNAFLPFSRFRNGDRSREDIERTAIVRAGIRAAQMEKLWQGVALIDRCAENFTLKFIQTSHKSVVL